MEWRMECKRVKKSRKEWKWRGEWRRVDQWRRVEWRRVEMECKKVE